MASASRLATMPSSSASCTELKALTEPADALRRVAAVIAIFFLLHASFGSLRLAALTFFTLPWALVGGVLAA